MHCRDSFFFSPKTTRIHKLNQLLERKEVCKEWFFTRI